MSDISIRSILIAALGGEGGGVLADWLVCCAQQSGLAVQATSVPGVAQRTGATSYYIECTTQPLPEGAQAPVFALSPTPACVDVVVASELLEAARTMERGFVTPERTCLIASTSRVYTTLEKMHMSDGRFDSQRIHHLAKSLSRRAVLFDMENLTQTHRTVVSAVMFGALSGAGVLPWSRDVCERVIKDSGKGVDASLAGFAAAYLQAELAQQPHLEQLSKVVQDIAELGAARCLDYQDQDYANHYLELLKQLPVSEATDLTNQAIETAARSLALWMCFEDVIRVADLKTRPDRFERIRQEARSSDADVVRVTEHFKPGIDEVAAVLPQAIGTRLLAWASARKGKPLHMRLHIRSTSIWGYLMLRFLAGFRPWRRGSLRYTQEHQTLNVWWRALCETLPHSAEFALVMAELPQVLKGYGDTQIRGRLNYDRLWQTYVVPVLSGSVSYIDGTLQLRTALKETLADPEGKLNQSHQGKPVFWLKQNDSTFNTTT